MDDSAAAGGIDPAEPQRHADPVIFVTGGCVYTHITETALPLIQSFTFVIS
jgi:hypothetical protein